jgi:outer membrane protein TolC
MRIKRTAALLCAFLIAVPQLAALANDEISEENEIITEAEEKTNLSLDDAISLAMENNPQIEAADEKIKSAELSMEVVKDTQKEFDSFNKHYTVAIDVSNSLDTAYLKHGYYPVASQAAIDLAVLEKEKVKNSIAYDVTEKYYNLKLAEHLLEIAQSSYDLVKENYDVVEKQMELGLVSQLEVDSASAALKSASYSVESGKRNISLAEESLKISMLKDGEDVQYNLTDDIYMPSVPSISDEIVSSALETRYDAVALEKSQDLKKLYFDITALYMNEKTAKYHSAYSDYLSAKYTYENSSKMIALSIRSEYASILSADESVKTAQSALDVKETEYESSKLKYEMGMITNMQLTNVMTELEQCRIQLENAKLTYMLAVEKYNYDIAIGV